MSSAPPAASAAPFRGPAADSPLGEAFLSAISVVCAHGHGLELFHARYVCGETFREGARRADGSLDTAGFLGGTADMVKSATRIHAPWLAEAREKGREAYESRGRTTQLIRAAYDGNEQRVRELVAAGAPLDLVDEGGMSALNWASYKGHAHIAKLLLDGKYEGKGADINTQSSDGWSPLIRASYNGHEAVVRLLLERGADIKLRAKDGRTALYWARRHNHASIVALLEARGAPE